MIKDFEKATIIPVYSNSSEIETINKALLCYEAGLNVFEFTNRNENALTIFKILQKETESLIDFKLGIGTVFNQKTAQQFLDLGAHFIVSPVFSQEVSLFCNLNQKLYIPGCGSVNEVYNAYSYNHTFVKLFPASVFGPSMVSAIKSVLPNVKIMPTGGIAPNENEINNWLKKGASCVGIGEKLFDNYTNQNKQNWIQTIKKLQNK